MKIQGLQALAVLSLYGMLTASLGAQTIRPSFNIPFEFSVQGKTMPAGEYQVSSLGSEFVQVENLTGGHESLAILMHSVGTSGFGDQPRLTFHRYADRYFLAQAAIGVGYKVLQVPPSRAEREAIKTAARADETVTLVALAVGR